MSNFRGLHHPGVVVPDLDRAAAFYCELAGFEKVHESGWEKDHPIFNKIIGLDASAARFCMLQGTNGFLELFEFSTPDSTSKPAQLAANDLGVRHLCFEVDDVASALVSVVELGGSKINEPVTNEAGITAVYCRDPFGNFLELVTPAHGGPFRSLSSLGEGQ